LFGFLQADEILDSVWLVLLGKMFHFTVCWARSILGLVLINAKGRVFGPKRLG
jgi:hypothetical protein